MTARGAARKIDRMSDPSIPSPAVAGAAGLAGAGPVPPTGAVKAVEGDPVPRSGTRADPAPAPPDGSRPDGARQARRAVAVSLAALGGMGVAAQSRINGDLGARLHDGITAAVISFGSGLCLLLVLLSTAPAGRTGLHRVAAALRTGSLRPWQCLGGVSGAYLVISQGVTVASLGVALFTVATVAGQSASSLVVDRLGIGPAGRQPFTTTRVLGAALAVAAVLAAVSGRLGSPAAVGLAVLPALAGMGSAWQQAVNGRVRGVAGSAMSATLVNFVAGCLVLSVAFGVDLVIRGFPAGDLPRNPVYYLGGSIGVVFIAIAATVVRFTGVLLLGLATIAGQLTGALVIDLAVPREGSRPGPATLIGTGLTLVAVLIAGLPARSRRRGQAPGARA